ncbi:MAG TPA: response regulator, partial [Xanthobacteraceae bacterium]|nr:response regulator [Xanthobacteraceae bacterium]
MRVLVVEDDAILLMDLETILSEAGAEIVGSCRTVRDALAAIGKRPLSVAVLDVRIGGETIAPVVRQLGKHGTPFVFYTGQVGKDPALAEWSGSRIVAKPASGRTIVAAVAETLASGGRW